MKHKKILAVLTLLIFSFTFLFSSTSPLAAKKKRNTTTVTEPTTTPTPVPTPTVPTKKVLGFTTYYYTGDKSSYNSMTANTSVINEIVTATHITDGLGNISGTVPIEQLTYANNNNITPYLMIGNEFKGDVAKSLLENATNRQNFINNIVSLLKTNNYKGVNIDLEGVYYYNRSHYSTLIKEIYSYLKPLGYTVSASVPAKTYDNPTNGWNGAYDYATIASNTDFVVIMTYDEHYPGGTPGPIASIEWVNSVINYASTVIPKEKIYLGLAAYGYDWSGSSTKAYSINGCYNVAYTNNSTIQWDTVSKSPYFKYTDSNGINHTVWFENAQSIGYKLDLVNSVGLGGVGIWRLGLENTDYWTTIKTKLSK